MRRVRLVKRALVGLAAVGLAGAVFGSPGVAAQEPPVRAGGDTVTMSRADSVRLRVLERVRGRAQADADTAADSLQAAGDTLGAPAGGQTLVGPARPSGRVLLPEGADSVMRALAELPGYDAATYRADSARFEARDRRLRLLGTPESRALFSGRGTRVEADSSIFFDDGEGRVRTTGQSLFVAEGSEPVESRALIYDLEEARGTAVEARTTYSEGANWYVQGNLDSVEQGRTFGTAATFTSCEMDPPHSHFAAREMKVVADQVLVARGVRMFVEDVPVLWLPFIAQNLGSGRASGLLTPRFSMNDIVRTSTGYERRISNVGYYWAMSDYSDMTVAMDWFSNHYTALSAGLRYRWRRQFLTGRVNLKQYWRSEGGRELALNTNHDWEASERTRATVSGRFVTSSDFVSQQSFDPREVTQTIDSNAGLSHRFDWGNLSVSANRRQYLTDDRTDMTLPSVNLSLSTMTLFEAPPAQASWYNNVSLSGGMRFSRDTYQRAFQPDTAFVLSRADEARTRGSVNAGAGLGNFNLGGRIEYTENRFSDVPGDLLPSVGSAAASDAVARMGGYSTGDGLPPALDPFLDSDLRIDPLLQEDPLARADFSRATANWSANLGYRQNLIGSTTLTPSLSLSGQLVRSDSIAQAQEFVAGPSRVSVGARLKTDVYGFYPGLGGFDAIRHKITPTASFDYTPSVQPTALQSEVFGARASHPRKVVTVGFNQTWEARRPEEEDEPEEETEPEPGEEEEGLPDDPDVLLEDPTLPGADLDPEEPPEGQQDPPGGTLDDEGLQRAPRSEVVTLLALNTNSVTYDVVEADSTGQFLRGFQTTRLTNRVRSDYLQGLDLSFEHDLFEDPAPGSGESAGGRRFAPHLSRLSLGFRLDHRSAVVQAVTGLLGIEADTAEAEGPAPVDEPAPEGAEEEEPGTAPEGFGDDRVIPGDDPTGGMMRTQGWNARVSYSLRRPRSTAAGSATAAQMVQWNLSFAPTPNWDATWSSSYDVEAGSFNDHMVRLRRDLHEWEASFGFRQTATGNWSFSFEVALRANRDLHFDYEQRSTEGTGGIPGSPF